MKKLPGAKKYGDITLKRGRTDPRTSGTGSRRCRTGKIDDARKNGSVVLYDYERRKERASTSSTPGRRRSASASLQAGGNDVLVEECTITHEGIAPA